MNGSAEQTWRGRRARAQGLLGGSVLMCVALFAHPRLAAALPACPIHQYLGVLCPGCGATRAMLALLHGRMSDAVRWNALFVLLLPLAIWFGAESYRRAVKAREFEWPQVPAAVVYAVAVAACVFTVLRNLG
jgi:hypothetical protein